MKTLKLTGILLVCLSITIVLSALFSVFLPKNISIFLGITIVTIFIWATFDIVVIVVDDNQIQTTISILFPEYMDGGKKITLYNCYYQGINFLWWWEKKGPLLDLKIDFSKVIKPKILAGDDNLTVSIQFQVKPDGSTRESISLFLMNGEDQKSLEKNIMERTETFLVRAVATFFSDKETKALTSGKHSNDLDKFIYNLLQSKGKEMGCITYHEVGSINESYTSEKARNSKKVMAFRKKAMEDFKDGTGLTDKEAMIAVLANADKLTYVATDSLSKDKEGNPISGQQPLIIVNKNVKKGGK